MDGGHLLRPHDGGDAEPIRLLQEALHRKSAGPAAGAGHCNLRRPAAVRTAQGATNEGRLAGWLGWLLSRQRMPQGDADEQYAQSGTSNVVT